MIDVEQVRELIELMVEHGLSEIRVRQADTSISLRRGPGGEVSFATVPAPHAAYPVMHPAAPTAEAPAVPAADHGLVSITSPMVGTYYSAPDPDSPPFVAIGAEIDVNTPVCIIEAMKVFNEIKAEVSGTIERILVHNQQAVEYGQPLMLVRPRT